MSAGLDVGGLTLVGETLTVRSVTKTFGGLTAVDDVSLAAEPGQVTALIGPNGAGKTTLFNCLTGLLAPDRGEVLLGDRKLMGLTPDQRARAGIARTFQRLEVFSGLTVFENLQVALEAGRVDRLWRDVFSLRHRDDRRDTERVETVLELLGIAHLADRPAPHRLVASRRAGPRTVH